MKADPCNQQQIGSEIKLNVAGFKETDFDLPAASACVWLKELDMSQKLRCEDWEIISSLLFSFNSSGQCMISSGNLWVILACYGFTRLAMSDP